MAFFFDNDLLLYFFFNFLSAYVFTELKKKEKKNETRASDLDTTGTKME